ncbi:predicted protein [Naegleria gruberi]|uniref:Predicted protein n=1 Tax=Naegleria gruberi TaxID=5762 RepID=D2VBT0_NAEGR|nr:uncharacterized protein NAEGRDRAFT_66322 [Naegleria gruberi]EFC45520.1 predicted protein [Naegleria gruberi]|eukprot:XP_002678264.1 predicted protein [Naegleria gruberi strain NEG-M]
MFELISSFLYEVIRYVFHVIYLIYTVWNFNHHHYPDNHNNKNSNNKYDQQFINEQCGESNFPLLRSLLIDSIELLKACFNFVFESFGDEKQRTFSKPSKQKPRSVCIIGAGVSGLVSLKTIIHDYSDVDFANVIVFERSESVGGLWNCNQAGKSKQFYELLMESGKNLMDNIDISPMYASLHTNTSRDLMGFSDFPMNEKFPDFPSCEQVNNYLKAYVEKFDLMRYVMFNTEVVSVRKKDKIDQATCKFFERNHVDKLTKWIVITKNLLTNECVEREFDVVIVGNGKNTKPRLPEQFKNLAQTYKLGKVFHSKIYQDDYEIFRDKTVLIIGSGSSGSDIASRVALVTENTYISVQKGASLLPKYLDGKPIDFNVARRRYFTWLPKRIQTMILNFFINNRLPKSKLYHPFNSNPSRNHTVGLSSELIVEIGFGRVKVHPPLVSFSESEIKFENGTSLAPDYIILSTGYELHFPFLEDDILQLDENKSRTTKLYEHIFHMDYPNLIFLGLPFTVHPLIVCELQARYAISVLAGQNSIPTKEAIKRANQTKITNLESISINPIKFFHREYHLDYCDKLAKLGGFFPNPFKYENFPYFKDLIFGPFYGIHFRMQGCGKLSDNQIASILTRYKENE